MNNIPFNPKKLSKEYSLGRPENISKFKKNSQNSLFYMKTTKGEYTIKEYNRKDSESVDNILDFQDSLKQNNFPVFSAYKNQNKDFLFFVGQKVYSVFDYVHGNIMSSLDKEKIKEMGHTLGDFHDLAEKIKTKKRLPSANPIENIYKKIKQTNQEHFIKKFENFYELLEEPSSEKQTIHGDMHHAQFLFNKRKLICMGDFDDISKGNFLEDIGSYKFWLNSWFGEEYKPFFKEFLNSYEKTRPLKESLSEIEMFSKKRSLSHFGKDIIRYSKNKIPLEKLTKDEKMLEREFSN